MTDAPDMFSTTLRGRHLSLNRSRNKSIEANPAKANPFDLPHE